VGCAKDSSGFDPWIIWQLPKPTLKWKSSRESRARLDLSHTTCTYRGESFRGVQVVAWLERNPRQLKIARHNVILSPAASETSSTSSGHPRLSNQVFA
jgi:hypothetical protein